MRLPTNPKEIMATHQCVARTYVYLHQIDGGGMHETKKMDSEWDNSELAVAALKAKGLKWIASSQQYSGDDHFSYYTIEPIVLPKNVLACDTVVEREIAQLQQEIQQREAHIDELRKKKP